MDNLIKYFNNIETSFRKMKFVTVLAVCSAAIVAVGSVVASGWFIRQSEDTIYVVDKGSAVMAKRNSEDSQRELEAKDHVLRFHELMFNLSPSAESIKRNQASQGLLCGGKRAGLLPRAADICLVLDSRQN